MEFWLTAGAAAVLVGLTIALGFLRREAAATEGAAPAEDIKVYRDQLGEVEKDVARGILAPADAERLRVEIARRILEADRAGSRAPASAEASPMVRLAGLATVPVILLAAFAIYSAVGTPDLPDQPLAQRLAEARELRATRPDQATAEAEMTARMAMDGSGPGLRPPVSAEDRELVARLREAVAGRPDDVQGQRLLAVSEAALGDFAAAHAAQARVVELLGEDATAEDRRVLDELAGLRGGRDGLRAEREQAPDDAPPEFWRDFTARAMALEDLQSAHWAQGRLIDALGDAATAMDHVEHADLLILSAGGYVSPEAEAALERALRREPRNPMARYFLGLMYAQTERPDLTFQLWRQLLEEGPPDAPWIPSIRSQIEWMAARAGVNYTAPPAGIAPGRGPTDADIAAAAELPPEDRVAMIEGMVEALAQRLALQGGSAEDWARLIASYAVIGRMTDARAVWTEAQAMFGGRPEALETVRAAAAAAGLLD